MSTHIPPFLVSGERALLLGSVRGLLPRTEKERERGRG